MKSTTSPSHTVKQPQLWSSTPSPSPCLSSVKQWIINPPEPGPIVFHPLYEFIHHISIFPQQGLITPLHFVPWNLSCVCGDARCSGTIQPLAPSISITTVTLGELHSHPTRPTPPLRPVEGKGNYAGSTLEQGKAKEHLNIYMEQGGRACAPSWFH